MREKLIEILGQADDCNAKFCENCEFIDKVEGCVRRQKEILADVLIDNGVTIQKWIPVSERLPEHGAKVLCATMFDMRVMHWNESAELWVDDEAAHAKRFVKRWLLIPEDPKEDE